MQVIFKRKLKDYEAWKKIVSQLDGKRKEYGSKGMTVYRSASDPNEVYVVSEWEDEKSFKAYTNLPEVQKTLADTGSFEIIKISESFHLAE